MTILKWVIDHNHRLRAFLLALVLLLAWIGVFGQVVVNAVLVWAENDIYTLSFFVVPTVVWLIWRLRHRWLAEMPKSQYVVGGGLLVLVGLIHLVGMASELQVLSHFAAFASLPAVLWIVLGYQVIRRMWFPLCFLMFCVPVGEELVPLLQGWTTDLAVPILKVFNIPVFREGLFIEIPSGRFVVAEACSGIRFFVASILCGVLYAYLSYRCISKRILFCSLVVLFPILANALRVVGIVMIGHWFGMNHASGFDHLLFGWGFFGLVMACLILLGEVLRSPHDKLVKEQVLSLSHLEKQRWEHFNAWPAALFVCVILVVILVWQQVILRVPVLAQESDKLKHFESFIIMQPLSEDSWRPQYVRSSHQLTGVSTKDPSIDVHVFWYTDSRLGEGELISSLNRLVDSGQWVLVSTDRVASLHENAFTAVLLEISSARGERRWVTYWYEVGGAQLMNPVAVKLWQAWLLLIGKSDAGALVALSSSSDDVASKEEAKAAFLNVLSYGGNKMSLIEE